MTKVLVLYYSSYGHIEKMAGAVAEGCARSRRRCRRQARTGDSCRRSRAQIRLQARPAAPIATVDELADYDAIIFGTPTRFGNMSAQMKNFLDQTGGLWVQGKLVGKVGSVFTSSAHAARRPGSTILSSIPSCCIRAWSSSACPIPSGPDGRRRGHGRLALWRLDHRRRRRLAPASANELDGARFQGRHVAQIAAKLARTLDRLISNALLLGLSTRRR